MRVDVYIRQERSEEELRSLQYWLSQEPTVRRAAVLTLREEKARPVRWAGSSTSFSW